MGVKIRLCTTSKTVLGEPGIGLTREQVCSTPTCYLQLLSDFQGLLCPCSDICVWEGWKMGPIFVYFVSTTINPKIHSNRCKRAKTSLYRVEMKLYEDI